MTEVLKKPDKPDDPLYPGGEDETSNGRKSKSEADQTLMDGGNENSNTGHDMGKGAQVPEAVKPQVHEFQNDRSRRDRRLSIN
jgi:hypothetical protein